MTFHRVFQGNPLGNPEGGELLTLAAIRRRARVRGGWKVSRFSPTQVVIYMPGGGEYGARFAGKKYTFTWDGTGYKRQGEYLYVEPGT